MSWEYKRALSAKLKSRFKHRKGLNNDSKTDKRRNTREKTTATERQRLEKVKVILYYEQINKKKKDKNI
ncbi:unnamed protein product, partial [Brenthis ino]